jgi:hypothetical protein
MTKYALVGALLLAFAAPAMAGKAGFYIVRGEDNKCKVVETAPAATETTITKVGKDTYVTREEAEADVAVVCK